MLLIKFVKIKVTISVNSVGVGRERMERYGDNPEADRRLLKVNGLGAAEVKFIFIFIKFARSIINRSFGLSLIGAIARQIFHLFLCRIRITGSF